MKLHQVLLMGVLAFAFSTFAEETTMEKAETMKNKTADGAKKMGRKAKDEVCEMVNGKMECAVKKGVNKVKDGVDATGTKATEMKNKSN